MSMRISAITVVSVLVVVALFAAALTFALPAHSQDSGASLRGYAWSDTVGWISLHCANTNSCAIVDYGIRVDADGVLSGKAWSEHIGWVSADMADLAGCPEGDCFARFEGRALAGWLRALAGGTSQSGGWDGFISLSGSDPDYNPTLSGGSFSGYAWGDTNVGWVDFSHATSDFAPDVCLNLPGIQPAAPDGYYEDGGQCYEACSIQYSCSGQSIQRRETNCSVNHHATCTPPLFCVAGSAVCLSPSPVFNPGAGLSGHLQARPLILPAGRTTRLHWDVGNVANCTVTGTNGDSWTGVASGNQGQQSSPLAHVTTFSLTCLKYDGTTFTESLSVSVLPLFREL